ncbi:MAG: hypothetical protein C4534_00245 [Gaiellales bacterium]|nr:MAG: hypothetical protein C4534_00245 [Gaiellales bacterium]
MGKQLRRSRRLLLAVFGAAVLVLAVIGLLRVFLGVDIGELTRDPIHKTGLHPFVGFLSNAGVLLWAFAAAICLFCAFVLRRTDGDASGFYLAAGLITAWMMLDDLFLFHDVILREYLGVAELVTYPLYFAAVAAFFYVFRRRVLDSEYVILILTAMFFLATMLLDLLVDNQLIPGEYLFEDGFKFLGIVGWLTYFGRTGFSDVLAAASAGRRARMRDGVCARCGSTDVTISNSRAQPELHAVPLAAAYRYEKPVVTPLPSGQLSASCNECGYSEIYLSGSSKLVSVSRNLRRVD